MRFEQLRLRVEQAERQVAASSDRAEDSRHAFGEAWRRGWSPGRQTLTLTSARKEPSCMLPSQVPR